MITKEENLILQSYMTVSLLAELGNNRFFESEYFNSMKFGQPYFKKNLREKGIDNQGCAIMSLYAMLVVPYELVREKFPDEFSSMNDFLKAKTNIVSTTYHENPLDSDLMYHLRNAISHGRVFFEGGSIFFTDSKQNNKKPKEFSGNLSLIDLSMFVHKLQSEIQMKVVEEIQSRI